MVKYSIDAAAINTAPKLSALAAALFYGNIEPATAETCILTTDVLSGNEGVSGAVKVFDDLTSEAVVKLNTVTDSQQGNKVVGFATLETIEKEFTDWQVFPHMVIDIDKVLYRGVLKISNSESYTPTFQSTLNVQIK